MSSHELRWLKRQKQQVVFTIDFYQDVIKTHQKGIEQAQEALYKLNANKGTLNSQIAELESQKENEPIT